MAYTANTSARNNSSAPAGDTAGRNDNIGGYLNIAVLGGDGQARRLGQGGRGIALRNDHPVEKVVLAFIREHGVEALKEKLQLTFGDKDALDNFTM